MDREYNLYLRAYAGILEMFTQRHLKGLLHEGEYSDIVYDRFFPFKVIKLYFFCLCIGQFFIIGNGLFENKSNIHK